MSFGILLSWVLGLPGLALSGLLSGGLPVIQHTTHQRMVAQSPSPSMAPSARATPRASVTTRPRTTPRANVATPSTNPGPAGETAKLGAVELASETTCPGQSDVTKTRQALTCLTANARVFHGLPAVTADATLMAAATAKNQDMLACGYGHTACGRDFGYWIRAKGYAGRCYGENIAMGQKTPREVFVAWMNSAGHRANILNRDYRNIGVAELASAKGPLWAMELGGCR